MKYLYDGFHKIEEIFSTVKGKMVKRERLILPSGVAGLVVNQNNEMALVKQFRPIINESVYEVPAGIMDKDKSKEQTLLEELAEECNIDPKDVLSITPSFVNEYYMVISSGDSTLSLYHVEVQNQHDKVVEVDDSEVEYVKWFTLDEVEELVLNKQIKDPKTLIAYFQFKYVYQSNNKYVHITK